MGCTRPAPTRQVLRGLGRPVALGRGWRTTPRTARPPAAAWASSMPRASTQASEPARLRHRGETVRVTSRCCTTIGSAASGSPRPLPRHAPVVLRRDLSEGGKRLLQRFLQDYDGVLPRPWLLDAGTGHYARSSPHRVPDQAVRGRDHDRRRPGGPGRKPRTAPERRSVEVPMTLGAPQRPHRVLRLKKGTTTSGSRASAARARPSCSPSSSTTPTACCRGRGCSTRRRAPSSAARPGGSCSGSSRSTRSSKLEGEVADNRGLVRERRLGEPGSSGSQRGRVARSRAKIHLEGLGASARARRRLRHLTG